MMRIVTYCGPQWVLFGVYRSEIVRNNSVRATAAIAYYATDMIVKVSIDRYLGQQQCENNI